MSSVRADEPVSERIYFVQQDGRHAMVYTTSRTDYSDYDIWFAEKDGYQPADYLDHFLYLFPKNGDWADDSQSGYRVLRLAGGDFASLERHDLEQDGRLAVDSDGVYRYRNWDGETRTPDGHYGLWNSPGAFNRIAYSWVFPENLEPVAYAANKLGEWVKRHNTVTYYGNNVNDLVFNIQYRPSTGEAYQNLKDLEGEGVEVAQEPTGVRVTLAETLLFPSGVASISTAGQAVLDKFAENLKQQPTMKAVVAGHTDNQPIGGGLVDKYPSNWELSSARSINIIRYLASRGVAEQRFESRAFSFMQPVDSNGSDAGRAKNRRIEIFLTEEETQPG